MGLHHVDAGEILLIFFGETVDECFALAAQVEQIENVTDDLPAAVAWNSIGYSKEVEDFLKLDLPYDTMSKILGGNFKEYFKL